MTAGAEVQIGRCMGRQLSAEAGPDEGERGQASVSSSWSGRVDRCSDLNGDEEAKESSGAAWPPTTTSTSNFDQDVASQPPVLLYSTCTALPILTSRPFVSPRTCLGASTVLAAQPFDSWTLTTTIHLRMPRHKPTPVARHDDFLSASDSSASDTESEHERYTDARAASAVALPPSRQGSYKDEDSEDEKGSASAHARSTGRDNSFDLGSSDGESDEERLVGTGKKGGAAKMATKKKQKRSWVMRSVGDGTTQSGGGGGGSTACIIIAVLLVLAFFIGGGIFAWKQGYLDDFLGSSSSSSSSKTRLLRRALTTPTDGPFHSWLPFLVDYGHSCYWTRDWSWYRNRDGRVSVSAVVAARFD